MSRSLIGSALCISLVLLPLGGEGQTPGATVAIGTGYDIMHDTDSGVAGELLAGYRFAMGLEGIVAAGVKLIEESFACPAVPTAVCTDPGGFEDDHDHRFAEVRYWFGNWNPSNEVAGYLGVRVGSVRKRAGGFDADGPTYGATGGAEFPLSETFAVSTSVIVDYVNLGKDAVLSANFDSWRTGLRIGVRALFEID